MNLTKKITLWQQADLLSPAQAQAILDYENRSQKPVLMYSFLFLSAFCIGLGIISLISANWQIIPPAAKLMSDFVLLCLVVWGIYSASCRCKTLLREGLNVLYALLILASIGLIAQIYHLQPSGLQAYLLWSVLTFPIVLTCKKAVLPLIWLPVFMVSAFDTMTDWRWFSRVIDIFEGAFPFAFAILCLLIYSVIYRLLNTFLDEKVKAFTYAMKVWMVVSIAWQVLIMDFGAGDSLGILTAFRGHHADTASLQVFVFLIAAVTAFGIFSYKLNYSRLLTSVIASLLVFAYVYMFLPDNKDIASLWGFLLTMTILGWLVVYALIKSRSKLMNLATALMACRIFVVYLQVFGSLLSTGIGLIISGVVLLLIIFIWRKVQLNKLLIVKEGTNA